MQWTKDIGNSSRKKKKGRHDKSILIKCSPKKKFTPEKGQEYTNHQQSYNRRFFHESVFVVDQQLLRV